jgi:hypothetical protein
MSNAQALLKQSPSQARALVPASSTTAAVMTVHRHQDGYIALASGDEDSLHPRIAILASNFEGMFPELRSAYLKDAYVSINAGYRTRSGNKVEHGYPMHRENTLRYLNACYADIDYYKLGRGYAEVLYRITLLEESGAIPKWSMLLRSGRGVWLFWLLHDEKGAEYPQAAFPNDIAHYKALNRELAGRLHVIGGDQQATDATRYMRLHGSLNTKSDELVELLTRQAGDGLIPMYSMPGLAAALKIDRKLEQKLAATYKRANKRNPNRKKGWLARWDQVLEDLLRLQTVRGKFRQGCRTFAVSITAIVLKGAGHSASDILENCLLLGQIDCSPRLTEREIRCQVDSVLKRRAVPHISNQRIADQLQITTDESEALRKLPAASGNVQPMRDSKPSRKEEVRARRRAIHEICMERFAPPPVRDMVRLLQERDIEACFKTVAKDYTALGILTDRKQALLRRETITPSQHILFPSSN